MKMRGAWLGVTLGQLLALGHRHKWKNMMDSRKFRLFVCLVGLSSASLWLFHTWTEFCLFCESSQGYLLPTETFRRMEGNFSQLPDVDCHKNPPFLVLLVACSSQQLDARMAIRHSWGRERTVAGKRLVTLFLLGSPGDPSQQAGLAAEGQTYRDIIQKNFTDTYYNLTLKTMMGMEWIHRFCSQASFAMKTDTDVFVNVFYLTELLLRKRKSTGLFTGFLKLHEYPIRTRRSKWYVSREEYPGATYPPFCSGTGYVLSSDVASQIYNISESVPFIKLEDVFIGLCLDKLKIQLEELHSEQTFFPERIRFSVPRFRKIVTCHGIKPAEQLSYWNLLVAATQGGVL
ncbi:beta-1,3-galactosyltransferase 5 [Geospiza fortis]|uniref:Hexosyltransferase n=7 Tax=Passeriformes TaxID=9126 RepID=A0A6I9HUQ7_GEOFO|nr:beta-1,3-galactosyltransferase 5 [Geospiza fortis]XP_030807800.1 beta-1,3-galactosyltransferase 5 [Camarhynchus parvulus]XP_030807809.1 beta-1,3-galactosyltransferase 5 [Camarhynchus parvulus]XP_030807817.1 beta-1,3-galactosyltransferase 5 [Camarhynchus parvulus]